MSYSFDFSAYNNIAIFPHKSPDGDAIGSAVALALYLKELGKKAIIVIDDEIQHEISFLLEYTEFASYEKAFSIRNEWDFCVSVDCGDIYRLGRREELIEGKKLLNIDHHITNPEFGDYNLVFSDSPATCEIVYLMIKENGDSCTQEIAEALYTGLSTDTGNFLYENVTPMTFIVASELLSVGINKAKIVQNLYQNKAPEKIKLQTLFMKNLEFYNKGKFAISYVDEDLFKKSGATALDTEGLVESLRDIRGVEIACFLKETAQENGQLYCKASLRSLPPHTVDAIASHFDGGGHKAAAGFTLKMPRDKAKEAILKYYNYIN